jgi:hypothetical protein
MKKNLVDKAAAESIVTRIAALKMDSKPVWGVMNATEMLYHCNLCNDQVLKGEMEYRKDTLKSKLLKVLALYIAPGFKKGVASVPRNDTKGRIADDQFDVQKASFVSMIRKVQGFSGVMEQTHPAFGNLNTEQWGIALYKHMDHHLRQFGV